MRAHLYDPRIAELLDTASNHGAELLGQWIIGAESKELMQDYIEVHIAVAEAIPLLKGKVPYLKDVHDRIGRINLSLTRGDKVACQQDVVTLIAEDLPGLRLEYERSSDVHPSLDGALHEATDELLRHEKYSDALRAAFPVFTERLRTLQHRPKARDGQALVNELFGGSSKYQLKWGPERCQAVRDLFAGLFGLFRNQHAHNATKAGPVEANAVVLLLHYLMKNVLEEQKLQQGVKKKPSRHHAERKLPPSQDHTEVVATTPGLTLPPEEHLPQVLAPEPVAVPPEDTEEGWKPDKDKLLSRSDVLKLLDDAKKHNQRLYVFYLCVVNAALSVSEAGHLKCEDLIGNKLKVTRRRKKTPKVQMVPLDPKVSDILRSYIGSRTAGYLFPGGGSCKSNRKSGEIDCKGGHIHLRTFQSSFRLSLARAGLATYGRGIHYLRHYAVLLFLKASKENLMTTKQFAGHSSSAITEAYIGILRSLRPEFLGEGPTY